MRTIVRRGHRSAVRRTAVLVVLAMTIAACTNNGTPETTVDSTTIPSGPTTTGSRATSTTTAPPSRGEELRLGEELAPSTLDPARAGGSEGRHLSLAYDPLIHAAPDGSFVPRLAESWSSLSDDNTEFEIVLREGVTFSDGEPLNADAVATNIEYYIEAGGQSSTRLRAISSVDVVDDLTVRITFSAPEPRFYELFSGGGLAGRMISPAAIADPDRLATATFGAGPYVLDAGQTVVGDTYVYVPSSTYWDESLIYWDKVSIRVIPEAVTRAIALTTGQIDAIVEQAGSPAGQALAGSPDFTAALVPGIARGIQLNDREGDLEPALADVRVRQALNFAVNREAITRAVIGEDGIPSEQLAAPGGVGYNEEQFYSYDPARARTLLADAGYPNGFTFPVFIGAGAPALFEAIASDLAEVGVTLEISPGDGSPFFEQISRYPSTVLGWGVLHPARMGRDLWLAGATGINPFNSSDPEIEAWDQQALGASLEEQHVIYQQVIGRLVELGWFLPIAVAPQVWWHNDKVIVPGYPGGNFPNPETFQPNAG